MSLVTSITKLKDQLSYLKIWTCFCQYSNFGWANKMIKLLSFATDVEVCMLYETN